MSTCCLALLRRAKADRKGVTALEYAVIAGVMIVAVSLAMQNLAPALAGLFGPVAGAF